MPKPKPNSPMRIPVKPGIPKFALHRTPIHNIIAGRAPLVKADVERIEAEGVKTVIDLREDAEWASPGRIGVEAVSGHLPYKRLSVPVRDREAPSIYSIVTCVALTSAHVADGGVYIHCRAGRERTGAILLAYMTWTILNASDIEPLVAARDAFSALSEGYPLFAPMRHQVAAALSYFDSHVSPYRMIPCGTCKIPISACRFTGKSICSDCHSRHLLSDVHDRIADGFEKDIDFEFWVDDEETERNRKAFVDR